jgi:hypothetical protein
LKPIVGQLYTLALPLDLAYGRLKPYVGALVRVERQPIPCATIWTTVRLVGEVNEELRELRGSNLYDAFEWRTDCLVINGLAQVLDTLE